MQSDVLISKVHCRIVGRLDKTEHCRTATDCNRRVVDHSCAAVARCCIVVRRILQSSHDQPRAVYRERFLNHCADRSEQQSWLRTPGHRNVDYVAAAAVHVARVALDARLDARLDRCRGEVACSGSLIGGAASAPVVVAVVADDTTDWPEIGGLATGASVMSSDAAAADSNWRPCETMGELMQSAKLPVDCR